MALIWLVFCYQLYFCEQLVITGLFDGAQFDRFVARRSQYFVFILISFLQNLHRFRLDFIAQTDLEQICVSTYLLTTFNSDSLIKLIY